MKLKYLVLTVVILAGLAVAAWLLTRPAAPRATDPRVGQPLLASDQINQAAQLKLGESGQSILLKKLPDNTWQVASYYDFPADFPKLAEFIRNLTDAKIQRFVTAKPERFSRLEFKDTSIALLDANGKSLWSVTLGKTADSGGRFIHFDDETKAYLVKLNAWLDTTPKNWADSTLLNLKSEDIAKIELAFPDANPVVAQRTKSTEPFKAAHPPEGQQLNNAVVTTLVRNFSPLHFTDTTAPDDPEAAAAAATPQRTIKFTTFAGETYTVSLGRKPESKKLPPPASGATDAPAGKAKAAPDQPKEPEPVKPEYETVPAGPVFARISSSTAKAAINTLMSKRAFKISDSTLTSLPKIRDELFEPLPPPAKVDPAPPATASAKTDAPLAR